jgi:hypothetical protein
VLAVAADPDEHETTPAHRAAVASAVATLNLTRTSETTRRPAENPLAPYNEQLTPSFPQSLCRTDRGFSSRAPRAAASPARRQL